MADRVQVMKQEWSDLGGDSADQSRFPQPIEPQEDIIESAGLYVQDASNRDESTLVARSGDDMTFKDGNNTTPVTLTDLLGGAAASLLGRAVFRVDGGMVYDSDGNVLIKVSA